MSDLSFAIDSNDAWCHFIGRRDEHRICTDAIHIDQCATFEVENMNIAIFSH